MTRAELMHGGDRPVQADIPASRYGEFNVNGGREWPFAGMAGRPVKPILAATRIPEGGDCGNKRTVSASVQPSVLPVEGRRRGWRSEPRRGRSVARAVGGARKKGGLTKGDAAILRFLAAAEILETD